MSYKTLVTVFRDAELDAEHLEAAMDFALREDAHLHVLALGIERVPPEAFYGGTSAIAMQSTISGAIEEADEAQKAASDRLNRSGVTGEVQRVVAQIGAVSHIISRYSSLSDMVILSRPYGDGRNSEDVAVLEAALFSTRTPVLVLPPGVKTVPDAKRVVVAWNQSSEALSAIRAALPMLKNADLTEILVIDPPKHGSDYADPGTQLAELLTRHGVEVDISVVPMTMPRTSDVIDQFAADKNADLVVMGAYSHSRLREAFLGGTTRSMLERSSMPVLMAH